MGFSRDIREKILIASARHCCVCHRYKGVKVEVHHIVPKAKGGTDKLDNAIALCFDCHADAGHYNTEHPKGTKFSYAELKLARDVWFEKVNTNNIEPPEEEDILYVRYLVCKSFKACVEVCQGDLSSIPVKKPLIVQNDVFKFQRQLVLNQGGEYRSSEIIREVFYDIESYFAKHPDAKKTLKDCPEYPYFQSFRSPATKEMLDFVIESDGVTKILLQNGVPSTEVGQFVTGWQECGDPVGLLEVFLLRPIWMVYLAVSNVSERPIRFMGIEGKHEGGNDFQYRSYSKPEMRDVDQLTLPAMKIDPDSTVLVPISTMVGSHEAVSENIWFSEYEDVKTGEVQIVYHAGHDLRDQTYFNLIGPSFWPYSIVLEEIGSERVQGIHELDLTNCYMLNRGWEAGSCPHLFFRRLEDDTLVYAGELFTRTPGAISNVYLSIPAYATSAIIAELEFERTHIEKFSLDGKLYLEQVNLGQAEFIEVPVIGKNSLEIVGTYYISSCKKYYNLELGRKNQLVSNFISYPLNHRFKRTENLPKESGHQNITKGRCPDGKNKRTKEDKPISGRI